MTWLIYALLSAITAALVAIFSKLGIPKIDVILVSTIRSIITSIFLICTTLLLQKFNNFSLQPLYSKEGLYIFLAAIAGGLSWLFYTAALKYGFASRVTAIDRLSIVFVVILSALFLGEGLKWSVVLGISLMIMGGILVLL